MHCGEQSQNFIGRLVFLQVMADYVLRIFQKHPRLVVDLKKELLDFISNRSNVGGGREEVTSYLHNFCIISGPCY